ncbi:hypothetical protein LMANV2_490038 [Leptospira interrogans serovar Manilae]|uniref:Uncharacterized protein n=1 Tax=Leptospira interrogans serovar Manilae TaxID=214675 RepID=A0AAQ1NZ68_LEPIR|nr:hypothetical protein LMANV2_490038 [Leptospira interrogans serovar Manilae]
MGMGNIVPRDCASPCYFTSSGHSKDRIDVLSYLSIFLPIFWHFR